MTQVASIQAQAVAFPELNVEPVQRRNYPYATMAAHVMGFIGEVNDKDLAAHKELKPGDLLGKRGVEMMYDEYLRGRDGAQYWEYDSHGRRLAEYRPARKEPVAGDNVYLTIDFDLQRRAEQYFIENEFVGSAVALDPRNGEVLAMVSSPAFNPNVYSRRFTPDVWRTIASNPFKVETEPRHPGTLLARIGFQTRHGHGRPVGRAIDTSTSFSCGGSAVFFGRRFRCYNKNGHGDVSVANALKVSCDIFFFNVGARLGVDRIAEYAHKLTFGEISRIDLDGEKAGLVPSTEWAATKQHRKWYPSETISGRHRAGAAPRHAAAGRKHDGGHLEWRYGLPAARREDDREGERRTATSNGCRWRAKCCTRSHSRRGRSKPSSWASGKSSTKKAARAAMPASRV